MKKRFLLGLIISSMLLTSCTVAKNINSLNSKKNANEISEVKAASLMEGISAGNVSGKEADENFINTQMTFSLDLFKKSVKDAGNENILVSPLSVQNALAMTANGAKSETKSEMEKVISSDITLDELNNYLYTYRNSLSSKTESQIHIANSIWFRDDSSRLDVQEDFLQKNADYYGADIYKSAFDKNAVATINNWVSNNTDKMIDNIVDEINEDTVMLLINALAFDAEWENEYTASDVHDGKFVDFSGNSVNAKMMNSLESYYLEDENAVGFIKDYKGGKYSFAALLPNEDTDINTYIESMSSQDLIDVLATKKETTVYATTPKFSFDYSIVMNDLLSELGMQKAFSSSEADFSGIAKSSDGNIYIGEVLHKTFICVDEKGTKAAAVTKVDLTDGISLMPEGYEVTLDRPFIFMIVDNDTELPVFMGAVQTIE